MTEEHAHSPIEHHFHFFWRSDSPFSQWHLSRYTLNGVEYSCAEQGMMHRKALLFNDIKTSQKVLAAKSPGEMRTLGRQVQGFKEKTWKKHRWEIVYNNNIAKYLQNKHLLEALMATRGQLVEASPSDRIWGIGLHEEQAKKIDPKKWPGTNILGIILTQLREDLLVALSEDTEDGEGQDSKQGNEEIQD